jgi:membrane associated rhomboid family serine protease
LPLVSIALVLANVVVYMLAIVHGGGFWSGPSRQVALEHGAVPAKLTWEVFFTAIFVGGSFPQLLANTIALALFGLNVEDAMGRARFLFFYLLGGITALLLTVLFEPASRVPLLGASGAVAAVLGGYLTLYPRARVIGVALIPFMATIVEVPATLLIGAWLLAQVWLGLAGLIGPIGGDWALAYAGQIGALMLARPAMRVFVDRARYTAKRRQPPPQPVY